MSDFNSGWNTFVVFVTNILPVLWVLYIIARISRHLSKGRSIGGAIIAELGIWFSGPAIAVFAIWIIFSLAVPKLESQSQNYSNDSKAGAYIFGCINSGGQCLQIGENAPIPTANFFPTPTTSGFFPTSTPAPAATEPPATAPIIPTDPNSVPPVATETTPTPAPVSGPPDPGLFVSNAEMAACTTRALTTIGFWTLTEGSIQEPSTGYLPIGSNWEISSPNWIGHVLPGSEKEEWTLCSLDYPGACSTITGDLARSLGGEVNLFQNRKAVQITGIGQLPEACWYLANPTP